MQGVLLAVLVSLAACGGSPSAGNTPAGPTPASPVQPKTPVADGGAPPNESECTRLLDHIVTLMVSEQRQKIRDDHDAAQKKHLEEAKAQGKAPPAPVPLNEALMWTDEDGAKIRESFQDEHLKECLKMPRATLDCALNATTAAAIREC